MVHILGSWTTYCEHSVQLKGHHARPQVNIELRESKNIVTQHNGSPRALVDRDWLYTIYQIRDVVVQGLPFANFEMGRVQSLALSYKIS